jgi:DNA-binding transcriptional ArsR family regulator
MADPKRIKLLAVLGDTHNLTVSDIATVMDQRLSTTSQQLRLLRSAGIVASRRDGQRVLTSLTPRGVDLLKSALS